MYYIYILGKACQLVLDIFWQQLGNTCLLNLCIGIGYILPTIWEYIFVEFIYVVTRLLKDGLCIKVTFMHNSCSVNYYEKCSPLWHICLRINQTNLTIMNNEFNYIFLINESNLYCRAQRKQVQDSICSVFCQNDFPADWIHRERINDIREVFKKLRREKLHPKNTTPSDPPPPVVSFFATGWSIFLNFWSILH